LLDRPMDSAAKMSHLKRTIDSEDEDEVVVQLRNDSKSRATGELGPRDTS